MSSEELNAWDWVAKMAEKITFIRLNVLDHRDITEEDYDILKIWYRQWWMGTHPLFQTKMEGNDETAVELGLFSDTSTIYPDGTEIEYTVK